MILRMLVCGIFKEFHVKVFNTGKVETPGVQNSEEYAALKMQIIVVLQPFCKVQLRYNDDLEETVLVNSNFNCGFLSTVKSCTISWRWSTTFNAFMIRARIQAFSASFITTLIWAFSVAVKYPMRTSWSIQTSKQFRLWFSGLAVFSLRASVTKRSWLLFMNFWKWCCTMNLPIFFRKRPKIISPTAAKTSTKKSERKQLCLTFKKNL